MQVIRYIFTTPGIGGITVIAIVFILLICYGLTTRWIIKGSK